MNLAKRECPGESLDVYLVQLILINEFIVALNGNEMYISSNEEFYSTRLDSKLGHRLYQLCPSRFPFKIVGEEEKEHVTTF